MNLTKLFEAQAELDKKIIEEKGLHGVDLLDKKILALQVELGELANEHRGFKFWSEDQKPRTYKSVPVNCQKCGGTGVYFIGSDYDCDLCNGHGKVEQDTNPLLEEYADCLHFILSIGNDLLATKVFHEIDLIYEYKESITLQFLSFNKYLHSRLNRSSWINVINLFLGLGEMLGFTWEQIEQAYYEKNEINHERQANGY